MKGFLRVFALLTIAVYAFAHPPSPPPKWKDMIDECKTKIGITEDLASTVEDDPKVKCFQACIMKTLGAIADGKVILEKELEFISKIPDIDDAAKGKLTDCAKKANEESDECEVVYAYSKCLKENAVLPSMQKPPMH